jgi:hypothetical protein
MRPGHMAAGEFKLRLSASLERGSAYDRRQFVRRPVNIGAGLREDSRPATSVIVFDLSTHGCGIESTGHLEACTRVWLKLPGLQSWPAHIVWADNGRGGLRFDNPLHESVVDLYTKSAGSR